MIKGKTLSTIPGDVMLTVICVNENGPVIRTEVVQVGAFIIREV